MSERILAQLSYDFVLRLREWATGRELPLVSSSYPIDGPLAGIGSGSRYHMTRVPPMLHRVHDTDVALEVLPVRYGCAVRQFWAYEGQSLRWHGNHRKISYHTFEVWVMKGHELLKAEFAARSGRWQRLVEDAKTAPISA